MKLCWGSTRMVLLIGRYAVKVPSVVEWRLFLHGLLANMQERHFSKTGWIELCPVVWGLPGGFLLVMRRAEPITRNQWEDVDYEMFVNIKDGVVPVENKMSSFGIFDGRLVAVDYGH